ncbi:MAG: hypothetical protein K8F58_10605, partial [Bauldia sp.]|nr:hypothetical protein [Bauldia sp.]
MRDASIAAEKIAEKTPGRYCAANAGRSTAGHAVAAPGPDQGRQAPCGSSDLKGASAGAGDVPFDCGRRPG